MLDTITMGVFDYSIAEDNRLTRRIDFNNDTGEVNEKYFFNGELFQLTMDKRGFRMKFSVPKIVNGINFYPVAVKDLDGVEGILERGIKEVGVKVDIHSAKVMRIDLFKNVMLDNPFRCYGNVLRLLSLKRTHKKDYVDGFLSYNTLRELCFYDKVREIRENLGEWVLQHYGLDKLNVMRGELRLLQHREVKKNGIVTFKDIKDNWEVLEEVYRHYIGEVFSIEISKGIEMNERTLFALIDLAMNSLREKGKEAFKVFGYYPFLFVGRNELMEALERHYERRSCFWILSKIEKYKKEIKELESSFQLQKLYEELRVKFLLN